MNDYEIVQVHRFQLRELVEIRIRNVHTGEEYAGNIDIAAEWRERSAILAVNQFARLEAELADK